MYDGVSSVKGGIQAVMVGMHEGGGCMFVWVLLVAFLGVGGDVVWFLVVLGFGLGGYG